MLCKQLVHMCNVELGCTLIWKYLRSYFNNFFEICFTCFKKHNISYKKMNLLKHLKLICCRFQFFFMYVHVYLFKHDVPRHLVEFDVQ
jgi:hypothetical protein